MDFEWDEAEAESNFRTHGVDFEEASAVFDDPWRLERFDDRRVYGEDRFLAQRETYHGDRQI